MNKYFLLFFLFSFLIACQEDEATPIYNKESKVLLLEQSMIEGDKEKQKQIAEELISLLKAEESSPTTTNDRMVAILERIKADDYNKRSMEIMGVLKDEYLETVPDIDPFIKNFWKLGRDLSVVAQTGYDPMLDLYVWNEFLSQVDCMEDSWDSWKGDVSKRNINEVFGEEFNKEYKNLESTIENYIKACNQDEVVSENLADKSQNLYQEYASFLKFVNEAKILARDELM